MKIKFATGVYLNAWIENELGYAIKDIMLIVFEANDVTNEGLLAAQEIIQNNIDDMDAMRTELESIFPFGFDLKEVH